MFRSTLSTLVLSSCALALTACEATKEELGLNRRTPDEFAVVQRAPLEMPPDYYLRPPTPGAARPQEQAPSVQAESALLGRNAAAKTQGISKVENTLLQQTNAAAADPTIRQTLDAETRQIAEDEKPTVQRILDIGGSTEGPAKVVDAPAEAARIKAAKRSGAPVTDGETPSIKK